MCTAAWIYSSPGAGFCTSLELHEVPVDSLLQTLEVPLNGSTTHQCISHLSQFCVICILTRVRSALSSRSFMKLLNNTGSSIDPWGTTSDWLSAGLCVADHSSLINPTIQTIFNLSYCPCIWPVFHNFVSGDVMGTVSKASLKSR